MKVTINRASPIPIHDQLVTQIALLIASGALAPGRRLPSVRDMESRLGVHRNTVSAVYKTLEAYGVVTVKAGSGVRVIDESGPAGASPALGELAAHFVAAARSQGHEEDAIRQAFERALCPAPVDRIVVVDPHEDFHPIYRHELSRRFSCPLEVMTLEGLATLGAERLAGAAVLTSLYHLTPVRAILGAAKPVIVFPVNTPEPLLAQLRELPAGGSVALISVSETMRRMAQEVIAALRGGDLDLLEAHPDDLDALRAVTRLADAILTDGPSEAATRQATPKPLMSFRLIPEAALAALADQLPQ
ncbi:MAG: GntR family transcriptional regulator [Candidatus Sericytochromatia bacterium]